MLRQMEGGSSICRFADESSKLLRLANMLAVAGWHGAREELKLRARIEISRHH